MSKDVTFITGNQNKADYLAKLLGMSLRHHKLDLVEIQSVLLDEVVEHKVREAYKHINGPVLVEDVSLGFTALNGLPGPFIKFFVGQPDGLEKLCRMLDAFDTRSAVAECTYGYYDGNNMELIRGKIQGVIADHPRGNNGFGWDQIFCPEGYEGKTRAELSDAEYDAVYQIIKPMAELRTFLQALE